MTKKDQAKITELTQDLQRSQADFANFKRRTDESRADLLDFAKQNVVMELLPLIDNLDRALGHAPVELKDNEWAKGVEQVAKQAEEVLRKLGIERIASVGEPFDHNLHEAIGVEEGEGEEEVVIEELQPGYRLGNKIIRHAMVKVRRK